MGAQLRAWCWVVLPGMEGMEAWRHAACTRTERSVGVHGQSVGGVRRPECRLAGPSTPRYLALPTLPLPARLLISCSLFATRRALLFSLLFARKAAEPTRRTSLRRKHPCCRAPTSCDSCVVYFAREGRPTEVSYPARLL